VVHNLEDVATVFGDILGGLVSVSAQNVVITLPAGAEALTSYQLNKKKEEYKSSWEMFMQKLKFLFSSVPLCPRTFTY
jgi:N-glycosylase/DNA lyase